MHEAYPSYPFTPRVTEDSRPFWEGCAQHKLLFQRCTRCGKPRMPASFLCPHCHSTEFSWEQSAGFGRIYSYVVFHRAFHPLLSDRIPYVVASVDLDEGVRLLTNIVNYGTYQINCGVPVEVDFVDAGNGVILPVFHCISQQSEVPTGHSTGYNKKGRYKS